VDRETPGYIVREECKRNSMRVKAGKRAARFEYKKIWKGRVKATNEELERKEEKTQRRRERNTIRETGMAVKKWKN
jgi:hypothetical protein